MERPREQVSCCWGEGAAASARPGHLSSCPLALRLPRSEHGPRTETAGCLTVSAVSSVQQLLPGQWVLLLSLVHAERAPEPSAQQRGPGKCALGDVKPAPSPCWPGLQGQQDQGFMLSEDRGDLQGGLLGPSLRDLGLRVPSRVCRLPAQVWPPCVLGTALGRNPVAISSLQTGKWRP